MASGLGRETKHLGLDDPTSSEASDQPVRISGIQAPECRNPHSSTACVAMSAAAIVALVWISVGSIEQSPRLRREQIDGDGERQQTGKRAFGRA